MSGDITGAWPGLSFRHVELPGRGLKLHVGFQGPEAGPPVMLVHGFPESWYSWRHVAPRLAAEGYRVILPVLRGYERSDKPEDVDAYHPDELGDGAAAPAGARSWSARARAPLASRPSLSSSRAPAIGSPRPSSTSISIRRGVRASSSSASSARPGAGAR